MGQSLVKNYLHITFSTKHREPFIYESVQDELFNYIGGTCKSLECYPIKVGGYLDHVHILCMLSKKIALMKLLEEVKSHSSKWIKSIDNRLGDFYWQNGYSAFSIHPSQVDAVNKYITNQKEHHSKISFKEELLGFLNKYKVEYDERYLWD